MGQAPPGHACNKEGAGTIFVKAGEFQERSPAIREWTSKPLKFAKTNDTLVCVVGATAGKVNLAAFDCAIGRSVAAVGPIPGKIDPLFLFHFLQTTVGLLRNRAQGAAQGVITREMLQSLSLVLPSLPEQRLIAAILDQADALRVKRREALAQLDELQQAIFIEMFGDLMSSTSPWESVPISKFVAGFESGKSVAADDEEDTASRYRVLKVSAVTSLEFKSDESKAAPTNHIPRAAHFVREGDLLFSRANTTELIGATAYVSKTPDNLLLPDKLWRFIWHEQPLAVPHFVNHLFRQKKFRAEIGRRASGSSGSMKNISQEKLLSVEVALPPLALQQKFSGHIEKIMKMKEVHIAAASLSEQFFTSLQHRAFRGEL